jgi:hypothetical protein
MISLGFFFYVNNLTSASPLTETMTGVVADNLLLNEKLLNFHKNEKELWYQVANGINKSKKCGAMDFLNRLKSSFLRLRI